MTGVWKSFGYYLWMFWWLIHVVGFTLSVTPNSFWGPFIGQRPEYIYILN
jgi:hypothetical protein